MEARKQTGGNHYAKLNIEPIDYITANELSYMDGNVVKYISRHRSKNGAEDIQKVKDYCDMILEKEYGIKDADSERNVRSIATRIRTLIGHIWYPEKY